MLLPGRLACVWLCMWRFGHHVHHRVMAMDVAAAKDVLCANHAVKGPASGLPGLASLCGVQTGQQLLEIRSDGTLARGVLGDRSCHTNQLPCCVACMLQLLPLVWTRPPGLMGELGSSSVGGPGASDE